MIVETTGKLPFETPEDPNIRIWRYLDFTKFVSMLESNALWFCRVDLIGDPYEGSTPKAEAVFWKRICTERPEQVDTADHNKRFFREAARFSRLHTYVNCWHMNEFESAAMWQLYSKDNASIAIQSSFARLRDNLPGHVGMGLIKYIDYEAEIVPHGNIINYCMHKRRSFEHERELRALIWALEVDKVTKKPMWPTTANTSGILVNVELENLVQTIVLAPNCLPWFEELVRSLIERYGLKLEIKRSAMENEPLV